MAASYKYLLGMATFEVVFIALSGFESKII